uniref:Uncharacterized protein n=1 Tax=Gibberella zeae TaxID=5518 RepID=A0A4E9E4A5_GIBZA
MASCGWLDDFTDSSYHIMPCHALTPELMVLRRHPRLTVRDGNMALYKCPAKNQGQGQGSNKGVYKPK